MSSSDRTRSGRARIALSAILAAGLTTALAACSSGNTATPPTPSDASAVVQQLGSVPVPTPPSATPTPVASPDHPQLLSIGEPVRADLPGGVSAVLTASGPVTVAPPPGSTPPEPVQGTLTVTITSVSGTLTVHTSDLTSRSEMGKTVPLSALGAADVTASPGHPATIQMRGIYTDGAAQITWASGGKAIAVWDFNIETD